jgi:hypothetical protein
MSDATTPSTPPATDPPPATPAAKVVVKDAPPAGDTPPASPDPAEWRQRAVSQVFGEAKDDDPAETVAEREKLAKLAGRYNTMGDALKALREAQAKISAGVKPMTLPKNATPEQIKEFREAAGIPETPDKYDLGLKEGTVLAEGDKTLLDAWVAKVHGANAPPAVVAAGAAALVELREAQAAAVAQKDVEHQSAVEEQFREEWGNQDYRKNIDGIKSMLGHAEAAVAEAVMNARGPDGRALANNPAVLRWLSAHARELGFVGATVTPAGGDVGASVADELDALKALMAKDIEAWHKNTKGQARYMQLVATQQRLAGKSKTAA